jgi:hypothetical protein
MSFANIAGFLDRTEGEVRAKSRGTTRKSAPAAADGEFLCLRDKNLDPRTRQAVCLRADARTAMAAFAKSWRRE